MTGPTVGAVDPHPRRLHVFKGHGTANDFVVLPDPDGTLDLGPDLVRALCDRRAGLGADGLLRVVPTRHLHTEAQATASQGGESRGTAPQGGESRGTAPQGGESRGTAPPEPDDGSTWFMDYRNADGSIAEMCGNGIRVVARYLRHAGLVDTDTVCIGTRAGELAVAYEPDGSITVGMGVPRVGAEPVRVALPGGSPREGRPVWMPNPHVVVPVPDQDTLNGLDLRVVPRVTPVSPEGQNVEFVVRRGPRHLAMRVHERGVGETRSCGTGICAAVVAAVADDTADNSTDSEPGGDGQWWRVDVPGGTCWARWHVGAAGPIELRGPAVLVAEVDVDLDALGPGRSPGA